MTEKAAPEEKTLALADLKLRQAVFLAKREFPKLYKETDGYNYTYSNLNTMMECLQPVLDKYQLDIMNKTREDSTADGKSRIFVKTIITYLPTLEEDEIEFGHLVNTDDAQAMGSYQTYYRRYNLLCYFNLIPEKRLDDDGESTFKNRTRQGGRVK